MVFVMKHINVNGHGNTFTSWQVGPNYFKWHTSYGVFIFHANTLYWRG